jgi:hypothetical protein
MHTRFLSLLAVLLSVALIPLDAPANTWTHLDKATLVGRRWEPPVVYSPEVKRFLVLGGRSSWADYRLPRSYDVLSLDPEAGQWDNEFPPGKDWGPKSGPCKAPGWKNEVWGFRDTAGTIRPNWLLYGTFSVGTKYVHDPEGNRFLFYFAGSTFAYDPRKRTWTDLAPKTHPEKVLGGKLLWGSMCWDSYNKEIVLFGGGNIQSERGDPGTWTYNPARNTWTQLDLETQPPQRANSQLVYDPLAKKVVLFGGDQLDQLVADTWTFDVVKRRWEQVKPAITPSPRAGHALLWLPKAGKVLLLGGYGYDSGTGYVGNFYRRLPLEAWTWDTRKNTWDLIRRFDAKMAPAGPHNGVLRAAVDPNDEVLVLAADNHTWRCRLDASKPDSAGTKKSGAKPGATERRIGPYDPAWFTKGVPAADPKKVAADLTALPANRWVMRPTPKLPRPNMDWGSAVFSPERDLILRFSGGHSAYSGTAPVIYDVKTDRYSLPFTPEMPLEFVGSNDQIAGEWSFKGNPWMTGHTYKATGYEPTLKALVFAAHEYTWLFDPEKGKWSRTSEYNPFRPNMYVVTLATTPKGTIAWADLRKGGDALWRLNAGKREWMELPLEGTLPAKSPDRHGMAYDSKRDRLLFFSAVDRNKGDVFSYDLKTGKTGWLKAAGRAKAILSSRETIYLPEQDAVLVGARVQDAAGKWRWALYDCARNAWKGVLLEGADPISKGSFNNSIGLVYDPNRKLIWVVGQNSHVHVLRLALDKADVEEWK